MKVNIEKYKYLTLFFFGALGFLLFAPFNFLIPCIFIFSILLNFLEKAKTPKESFLIGWVFGLGFFLINLSFVSNALFVDIKKFWPLLPLALLLLPCLMALYFGLACFLTFKTKVNPLIFSSFFLFGEILRTYLFTGFPWSLIGYSANANIYLAQGFSLFGVYGYSFILVIFGSSLYRLTFRNLEFICSIIVLMILCIFGSMNIKDKTDEAGLRIKIIQANIEQSIKWSPEMARNHLEKQINLSKQGDKNVDYVIWPEASINYELDKTLQEYLANEILQDNSKLILGILRSDKVNKKIWNSLVVVDNNGELVEYYNKIHLVPFGEYIPFRNILKRISNITNVFIDVDPGEADQSLPESKFAPLICYEAIFSFHPSLNHDYDWIVNLTNDGWFGNSLGPYQHLEIAKTRAIERGKPLIRVANTGISAYINSKGEVVKKLGIGSEGYLDVEIRDLKNRKTIYNKIIYK